MTLLMYNPKCGTKPGVGSPLLLVKFVPVPIDTTKASRYGKQVYKGMTIAPQNSKKKNQDP
eukprot:2031298-Rhodomonas_salina.1